MTIADIGRILGQQDHEHVIDAARRVVRERDEAVAEEAGLRKQYEMRGNELDKARAKGFWVAG